MARYQFVFFDVGETLAYPHPSFHEVIAEICQQQGYLIQPDDVRQAEQAAFSRGLGERWSPVSFPREASRRFWLQLYEAFVDELGLRRGDGLEHLFYQRFTALNTWRLFEDVLPTLRVLQERGIRMAAISNWEDWLEQLLIHLNLTHYFEFALISGVVEIEKPDPRIFRLALEQAGVRPEEALHVGDSLDADVEGARQVGLTPVLLDRKQRHGEVEHWRISDLRELVRLVGHE